MNQNLEQLKDIKSIIVDWDDTIISTRPAVIQIVNNFADTLGIPRPGEEGLLKYWGLSVEEMVEGLFAKHRPGLTFEELFAHYTLSIQPNNKRVPFKGIEEAIFKLNRLDYIQGIISSGSNEAIIRDINTHYPGVTSVYSFIHGREETQHTKPDPRVFDKAFDNVLYPKGIDESQTVYVGDFHKDFMAAKARGLHFIGVADNPRSRDSFIDRGLDERLIFSSFVEISDFIYNLRQS